MKLVVAIVIAIVTIIDKINIIYGDLTDKNSLLNIFNEATNNKTNIETIEIYNLNKFLKVIIIFNILLT